MNNSSEYKKYFDNVSPDQELVNKTRNMMLSELGSAVSSGRSGKISYKKYGMVAVCAAAAAVAIIVSPKIGGKGNNGFNSTVNDNSAEIPAVSVITDNSPEITSDGTDPSGMPAAAVTSDITSVSDPSFMISVTENKLFTKEQSVITSASPVYNTNVPAVTSAPETAAVNDSHVTAPVTAEEIPIYSQTLKQEEPETSVSIIPNFRPGVTSSAETTDIPVTESAASSADSSGNAQPPAEKSDYIDTVKSVYNGIEYSVYLNKEYDYNTPHIMDKDSISIKDAEDCFGNDLWPSASEEDKSSMRIFASDKNDPGSGIYFISGRQTSLSDRNSRFAAVSISDNGTDLRYSVSDESEAVSTVIDSCTVVLWQLVQYDDVYICSYLKNGHRYDVCFKGYSINEITEIIMN